MALVAGASGGGMRAHVRMLAAGLASRGVTVTALGPRAMTRELGDGAGARVSCGVAEIASRPRPGDAATALRLRRLLLPAATAGPDVVHAHGLRAGALCALALAGARRRPVLVVTVHNAPSARGGASSLAYRALELAVARRADVVLCVSGDLERRMRARGARRVARAVVPAPSPPDFPGQRPDGAALPPGWPSGSRPVVLAAGRLAPQKGLGVLLEAAATWQDMTPRPRVVIAGDGPLAADLRERAAALGVDAEFLGHRDDVSALLAAAGVAAVPSLWEGQPLIVQEALRSGTPIVATRAGGIPELTGPDAALLVSPGDPGELAAAVRSVLTQPELAARLRAAALARAARLPTEADAVNAALAAYGTRGDGVRSWKMSILRSHVRYRIDNRRRGSAGSPGS